MNTPQLSQRTLHEPFVGAEVSFRRTITEADAALFIGVTWDVNPLHSDDEYVANLPFKKRIVPGLLTASLLTHLGGLWAFLAQEMKFTFIAPVFIGDTITSTAKVVEWEENRNWVKLECSCHNQHGEEVLRAEVTGYPGKFEAKE